MSMNISMEDDLERDFTEVCREMGLSPSTAIPFTLSVVSSAERAAQAYELPVADGIRCGMADVVAGDVYTREDVRAMRTASPCV